MPHIRRHQCNRARRFAKPILLVAGAALALAAPPALAGAPAETLHLAAPIAPAASINSAGSTWPGAFWFYFDRFWQILKRYTTPTPLDMNAGMAAVVDHYNALGIPGDLLLTEVLAIKDAAANLLLLLEAPPDGAELLTADQFKRVLGVFVQL